MVATVYTREKNIIRSTEKNEDGGPREVLVFDSINQAKIKSRELQGTLGNGYLRLVKNDLKNPNKKPKFKKVRYKKKSPIDIKSDELYDAVKDLFLSRK